MNETDTIQSLVKVIPTCDGVEIIKPIQVGSDGWQNELLLFVKPEAFIAKGPAQVQKILELVFGKLQQFDAQVSGVAVVGGSVLDRLEIMSRHYGFINRLSQSASQIIDRDDRAKIAELLQVSLADYTILGGHEYLRTYPEETSQELDKLWFESRSTKVRSGFYVKKASKNGVPLILVNAFHPEQLRHFTEPSHRIALVLLRSNTSWRALRNEMIGATFPDKAAPDSIRGTLYAAAAEYGFESIGVANNVVHLSAGPFEGLFEIVNFFSKISDLDLDRTPPLVLKRMLQRGMVREKALAVLQNPPVSVGDKLSDLFTQTEDLDTDAAVQYWQQV